MKRYFGLQLHITDLCDQKCCHCYIYSNNKSEIMEGLEFDKIVLIINNFLEFCDKYGVLPHIFVTGGDPLLHKDIWAILEYLFKNNVKFSILGNPFHLTNATCIKLKELGCYQYQMSLDGLQVTHDSIRKSGSFNKTIEKYNLLRINGIRTAAMTTVSKYNISDIPKLIQIVVDNKIDCFAFARYCPKSKDEIQQIVSPHEYKKLLSDCWNMFRKNINSQTVFCLKDHLWIPFLDEIGQLKLIHNSENYILDGCNCAIAHMTVLPNGDIYACRRFESKVGNALVDKFSDVYVGNGMEEYRHYDKFQACSSCKYLYYCRGCPAVMADISGDFYSPDPQCWIFKEKIDG